MTEPICIPVSNLDTGSSIVEITPEIARQIMAMVRPDLSFIGSNLQAPLNAAENVPAQASGDDPERGSGLSSAEWQSIRDKGLWLLPIIDKTNQAPASGGDEEALRGLMAIEFQNSHGPWHLYDFNARAILAAIRSGAIPLPEDVPQIAALSAKLESVTIDRDKCQRNEDEVGAENERLSAVEREIRADLIQEQTAYAKLEADRDAMAKRLAEAEARHSRDHTAYASMDDARRTAEADRDQLAGLLVLLRNGIEQARKSPCLDASWHIQAESIVRQVDALAGRSGRASQ